MLNRNLKSRVQDFKYGLNSNLLALEHYCKKIVKINFLDRIMLLVNCVEKKFCS